MGTKKGWEGGWELPTLSGCGLGKQMGVAGCCFPNTCDHSEGRAREDLQDSPNLFLGSPASLKYRFIGAGLYLTPQIRLRQVKSLIPHVFLWSLLRYQLR